MQWERPVVDAECRGHSTCCKERLHSVTSVSLTCNSPSRPKLTEIEQDYVQQQRNFSTVGLLEYSMFRNIVLLVVDAHAAYRTA